MADQAQSRQQFESAVIERLGAMFPAGTPAEQLRSALLQRGPDGDYADRQRAGEWWAWQSARRQTLHVVAAGICEGARIFGAYTDPATAECVKQAAWDAGCTDGASVTAVVIDEIAPAMEIVQSEPLATDGFTPGHPPESVQCAWLLMRQEDAEGEVDSVVLGVFDGDWYEAGDWRGESTRDPFSDHGQVILGWKEFVIPAPVLEPEQITN